MLATTGRNPEPPKPELKTPRNLVRDKERAERDLTTGGPSGAIAAGVYEAGKLVRDYIMQKEADKYNEQYKTERD